MSTNIPGQPPLDRQARGLRAVDQVEDFESEPDNDVLAEASSLGAMILSSDNGFDTRDEIREVFTPLGSAAFYRPNHGIIFQALCELHDAGMPTNAIALTHKLRTMGELDRVGGPAYVHSLVQACSSQMASVYDAETVRDLAMRRRIDEALTLSQLKRRSGEGSAAELGAYVLEQVEAAVDAAVPDTTTFQVGDFMEDVIDDLERKPESGLVGLPTGFKDLDEKTTGLRNGEYIVIAARPAMGKTTLALDIARENSVKNHVPGLIFSLEMGKEDIVTRMISAEERVPLHLLRKKELDDPLWKKVAVASKRISRAPLYIDDAPHQTIGEIESKARRYVKKKGVRYLVLDYVQLVKADRPSGDATRDVTYVSDRLRGLAKSLNVPIVVLAQLNRSGATPGVDGTVRPPTMADLKQSGQIEQDAHVVILLHREDYYQKESPRSGEADLIVDKCRSGAPGVATVAFQGHYARFKDMDSGSSAASMPAVPSIPQPQHSAYDAQDD